jgi:hypothetical protein
VRKGPAEGDEDEGGGEKEGQGGKESGEGLTLANEAKTEIGTPSVGNECMFVSLQVALCAASTIVVLFQKTLHKGVLGEVPRREVVLHLLAHRRKFNHGL